MRSNTIEDLLPSSGHSVYRLIRMASSRALEISDGKPSLVKNIESDKATSIALEEIAQGKVETKEVAESRQNHGKKSSK